jgi:LmbE family N-acetylglucosaminyl deacetylase
MIGVKPNGLRRVLCLGAHSDDIEIGCGGTLLRLLAENAGLHVDWVVFSGDAARAAEATESAREFLQSAGESRITIKGFRDSYFPFEGERVKDFVHGLAAECRPDLIFTHRKEDAHQDHRLLADLTWCAFRDHLILEYEIPKYEGDLGTPNVFVPLSKELCARKVDALQRHFGTQRGKRWFSEDTFWSLLRLRGLECQSPSRYAEAFHCRKIVL